MKRPDRAVVWHEGTPPEHPSTSGGAAEITIAIPARDEAELITACLRALAEQQDAPPFTVVLVLNNCSDGTAGAVRAVAHELPYELHVYDIPLPPELSDAAWARRLAMNAASALVRPDGLILSTDADSRADANWVRMTLDCFDAGADIVCGFVAPDFSDAPSLSFEAIRRGALEFEYSQLTSELCSLIDPDPADPWPRHLVETGANLAIRSKILTELGGVPHVCPGEDQVMVGMARRRGYKIRHAFAPSVTTSSRVRGRAAGGWSDDLNARLQDDRATCHPKLEPARSTLRRATMRANFRSAYPGERFIAKAARLGVSGAALRRIEQASCFEEAWALLEETAPILAKRPLHAADLESSVNLLRAYAERLTAKANNLHAAKDQALEVK